MLALIVVLSLFGAHVTRTNGLGEIIFALNAGGESHTDSLGIRYRRDYLGVGTASDYGRMLDIKRVSAQDKIVYQTERYATETFGYSIPMPAGDGDYVLWLKFSEVWFNAANLKVFDVALNDAIIVKDLDIFERVGRGVAHDERIPFQIRQNKLIVEGKGSQFTGEIRVDFIKTEHDNPKINAVIVMKGTVDQIPELPPYKVEKKFQEFDEDDDDQELADERAADSANDDDDDQENAEDNREAIAQRMRRQAMEQQRKQQQQKRSNNADDNGDDDDQDDQDSRETASKRAARKSSYPKASSETIVDPYASDETSYIIPILVAVGAFIPLLFCLCKI